MHCFTLATPMIKYKNLCAYNLSMETKDLTRDEAREAIGILALRNDNLDNILMSGVLFAGTLLASIAIIITSNVATFFLNPNNPHSSVLLILNLPYLVILFVLLFVFLYLRHLHKSTSKGIEEKMKKLAKEHNLEAFLDAISGKK